MIEPETEGEIGKKEIEIGIAVEIGKIEIKERREIVKEVVEKGIEWTGRGTSEEDILRKFLSAIETATQSVGGKQISYACCEVQIQFRIVQDVEVRYLNERNFQV